jgi:hypothetical protein
MSRIRTLFAKDKDAWCREFFPEYAEIFGGYPKPVKISYGIIGGLTSVPEMTPWLGWNLVGEGFVQASGARLIDAKTHKHELVGEDEYRAWADSVNYFKNGFHTPIGGPGLDPSVFVGAVDIRYGAYWVRRQRYHQRRLLVKPNYITCKNGRYFPMRGPSPGNPWGVNSATTSRQARSAATTARPTKPRAPSSSSWPPMRLCCRPS